MRIEAMTVADWPLVKRIYEGGIAMRQATFETVAPDWPAWDARHLPSPRLVARDPAVVGWAALSRVWAREVYRGVCEVSVYVDEEARGRGIGSLLLAGLVIESERAGIWTLQASVFPENAASVRLHQRHGFRVVGKREKIAQHHGVWRDTLLLERRSSIV
ncbi:MAG TPA: GNAT family N-acetyltransferase [Thermoanaerobaculia bacterium]|nr:GNAT family N-acetyltransferase [Thermoanaerobaculia bacterium]